MIKAFSRTKSWKRIYKQLNIQNCVLCKNKRGWIQGVIQTLSDLIIETRSLSRVFFFLECKKTLSPHDRSSNLIKTLYKINVTTDILSRCIRPESNCSISYFCKVQQHMHWSFHFLVIFLTTGTSIFFVSFCFIYSTIKMSWLSGQHCRLTARKSLPEPSWGLFCLDVPVFHGCVWVFSGCFGCFCQSKNRHVLAKWRL